MSSQPQRVEDILVPVKVAFVWDMQDYNRPTWFWKQLCWISDKEVCFRNDYYSRILTPTIHILWIIKVRVSVILSALWIDSMSDLFSELWIQDISWDLAWESLGFKRKVIRLLNNTRRNGKWDKDPFFIFDENRVFDEVVSAEYERLFLQYVKDNSLEWKLVPSNEKIWRTACAF